MMDGDNQPHVGTGDQKKNHNAELKTSAWTDSLPSKHLLNRQARWLAPARARLLRRVAIARKRHVLDLGAGFGTVTHELARRTTGSVLALDVNPLSLHEIPRFPGGFRVAGNAASLPLADAVFDLVFSQCALLWMRPLRDVIEEIWRVLEAGGVLVALEPDYGALIEFPGSIITRDIWLSALIRAGAEPEIGRILPGILERHCFAVKVSMIEELRPTTPERFDFLRDLPLSDAEQRRLKEIEAQAPLAGDWQHIAHLPFFLIVAKKET